MIRLDQSARHGLLADEGGGTFLSFLLVERTNAPPVELGDRFVVQKLVLQWRVCPSALNQMMRLSRICTATPCGPLESKSDQKNDDSLCATCGAICFSCGVQLNFGSTPPAATLFHRRI